MDINPCIKRLKQNYASYLKYHASTILTILAVAGVGLTVVSVSIETLKINKLIDQKKKNGHPLSRAEKVEIILPKCIIPLLVSSSTIGLIVGANILNRKKCDALSLALCTSVSMLSTYKNCTYDINTDVPESGPVREKYDTHLYNVTEPDQKCLYYDPYSGTTIKRYERELIDAEYHMNRTFTIKGYVNLNYFYELLGLPKTKLGEEVGWSMYDGYIWIDFEHIPITNPEGKECYELGIVYPPDEDYLKYLEG